MKGFTQIDYIIALGVILLVFALVVQYVNSFFSDLTGTTDISVMTSEALDLLEIAENGYEPDWPNASIVLLLHLDNSTLDGSQYANDGVLNGADCGSIAGAYGYACNFTNGQINVTESVSLRPGNITVEAWLNPYDLPASSYAAAVVKTEWTNGYGLVHYPGGSVIGFFINNNATNANGTIQLNNWSHVVGTYNGSNISLYINGNLVSSTAYSGAISHPDRPLYIGAENGSHPWKGMIDEVIVYSYALSQQEVSQHYSSPVHSLHRIGISSRAYRLRVTVNNTQPFMHNQTAPVSDVQELVVLNYTDLGINPDIFSTAVYDESNYPINYSINGNIITFAAAVSAGGVRNFTVYFDDDSHFANASVAQQGVDNLSERIFPEQVRLVQYKKIAPLRTASYAIVKNSTRMPRDFRITITDVSGTGVLNFGPEPAGKNIVALKRLVLYQNKTGGVGRGILNIRVW